jgi:hypothetical protein
MSRPTLVEGRSDDLSVGVARGSCDPRRRPLCSSVAACATRRPVIAIGDASDTGWLADGSPRSGVH